MINHFRICLISFITILSFTPGYVFSQCTKDLECKGDRICEDGICIDPPVKSSGPSPCEKDTECPGDEICAEGICTKPEQPGSLPVNPATPADTTTDTPPESATSDVKTQSPDSKVRLTPRFGLNFNWSHGETDKELREDDFSFETYWGFRGGCGLGIRITPVLSVEPALVFEQKGSAFSSDPDFPTIDRLSYISIPIATQWHMFPDASIIPFISAGPLFSICITSSTSSYGKHSDIRKYTRKFFFGLMAGAGALKKAGVGNIMVEAGYTWGLTKIYNETETFINSLTITGGYQIPF